MIGMEVGEDIAVWGAVDLGDGVVIGVEVAALGGAAWVGFE